MNPNTRPAPTIHRHTYTEFIFCPYCGGRDRPRFKYGPVYLNICPNCNRVYRCDWVELIILEDGHEVWLGDGFDTQRDDLHPFNQEIAKTPGSHNPPLNHTKR